MLTLVHCFAAAAVVIVKTETPHTRLATMHTHKLPSPRRTREAALAEHELEKVLET